VTNLIENAIRYTPTGGIVKLSVCGDRERALLRVKDTGEGIAPEHLPHLTERFYRADASRNRSDGGVGLGLAICKTVVEAHGGKLSIESVLGVGTTVSIEIPAIS
jgi:signal transduction histidine kinase